MSLRSVHHLFLRPCFDLSNPFATPVIYTLSLHDALPISQGDLGTSYQYKVSVSSLLGPALVNSFKLGGFAIVMIIPIANRSEEHTSELQSLRHLVCRLLLEKKK